MSAEICALLVTILVEFAVYMVSLALIRRRDRQRGLSSDPGSDWRIALRNSLLINCLTQPLVSLTMIHWFSQSEHRWWTGFFLVETIVIVVETLLIRLLFGFNWKRSFAMSLVANGVTASLSFLF